MLINLKKFRIKNNLTQAQLSKLIGYDQTIISQWEHGSRDPNTDTLLSIAKILNVSTDSLVGNDKCEVNNYAEENKFLNLSHLTQDQISTINTFIELSDDLKEKASIYINTLADVNKDFILKKIK